MVPTHQGRVDGLRGRTGVGRSAVGDTDQRQAGLALCLGGPLDRLTGGPPPRTVLDARGLVEHAHRAPPDAEPHVDPGGDRQADGPGCCERVADAAVAALEFVADGEGGWVDRVAGHGGECGVEVAVQRAPVGRATRSDDVPDEGGAQ